MPIEIPYSRWQPLSVAEVVRLFAGAPFAWGFAGGHAVELFIGKTIREHDDIDVLVFRDDHLALQRWLAGWDLFAADPPGTLRPWLSGELPPIGIHDIWAHRQGARAWELQLMLAEVEGEEWISRRSRLIRGRRDELFTTYLGLPCLRIEIQLLYKAKNTRPKDEIDFQAALPLLSASAREWLSRNLLLAHPEGHAWMDQLL